MYKLFACVPLLVVISSIYTRVIPNQIWVAQAPRWFSSRKRPAPAVPRWFSSKNARRKKMQEWSSPRVPIGRIGSQKWFDITLPIGTRGGDDTRIFLLWAFLGGSFKVGWVLVLGWVLCWRSKMAYILTNFVRRLTP